LELNPLFLQLPLVAVVVTQLLVVEMPHVRSLAARAARSRRAVLLGYARPREEGHRHIAVPQEMVGVVKVMSTAVCSHAALDAQLGKSHHNFAQAITAAKDQSAIPSGEVGKLRKLNREAGTAKHSFHGKWADALSDEEYPVLKAAKCGDVWKDMNKAPPVRGGDVMEGGCHGSRAAGQRVESPRMQKGSLSASGRPSPLSSSGFRVVVGVASVSVLPEAPGDGDAVRGGGRCEDRGDVDASVALRADAAPFWPSTHAPWADLVEAQNGTLALLTGRLEEMMIRISPPQRRLAALERALRDLASSLSSTVEAKVKAAIDTLDLAQRREGMASVEVSGLEGRVNDIVGALEGLQRQYQGVENSLLSNVEKLVTAREAVQQKRFDSVWQSLGEAKDVAARCVSLMEASKHPSEAGESGVDPVRVGDAVHLSSLVQARQHNGERGTVVLVDDAAGRVGVELESCGRRLSVPRRCAVRAARVSGSDVGSADSGLSPPFGGSHAPLARAPTST